MDKDFHVGESHELVQSGHVYDLHNCYDFERVCIRKDRVVSMHFAPDSTWGRGEPSLTILFDCCDYLEIGKGLGSQVIFGVEEFGYKSPDDRDDDWLKSEGDARPEDHFFVRLVGEDCFIRLHARSAKLVVQ